MQQPLLAFVTTRSKLIVYEILRSSENTLDWSLADCMCKISRVFGLNVLFNAFFPLSYAYVVSFGSPRVGAGATDLPCV